MYVVLVGNPIEGLKVFGPFKSKEEAHRWAQGDEQILDVLECWIVPLKTPILSEKVKQDG